jgi:hypothetical protein
MNINLKSTVFAYKYLWEYLNKRDSLGESGVGNIQIGLKGMGFSMWAGIMRLIIGPGIGLMQKWKCASGYHARNFWTF